MKNGIDGIYESRNLKNMEILHFFSFFPSPFNQINQLKE